jgi:hypothetical protein
MAVLVVQVDGQNRQVCIRFKEDARMQDILVATRGQADW